MPLGSAALQTMMENFADCEAVSIATSGDSSAGGTESMVQTS